MPARSKAEKKLLTWHCTYGDIALTEEGLRRGRRGPLVRPFCEQAGVRPRACSLRLQRALVDFGADDSFREAAKKVRAHYGVDVSPTAAREHTLAHAQAIGVAPPKAASAAKMVITGLDGSMVPIVEGGSGPDRRKGKALQWKQANLCCARAGRGGRRVRGDDGQRENGRVSGWKWPGPPG
jgi:hypothetical protein